MKNLNDSIEHMANRIVMILGKNVDSIWLYGSVVLGDFRPGWSDIDLLALAVSEITEDSTLKGERQDGQKFCRNQTVSGET